MCWELVGSLSGCLSFTARNVLLHQHEQSAVLREVGWQGALTQDMPELITSGQACFGLDVLVYSQLWLFKEGFLYIFLPLSFCARLDSIGGGVKINLYHNLMFFFCFPP